ncbi:hypothetical protein A2701_02950 [Candidatus Amesbacteria bacterium RIFCSPHIGHO2_01_FULL_47_34]|nr:MAG: hypothetical protein A2701_02950 [Candidatus Amesbacteria bacterium RIFCSPHIGHO2_01_FULL_47_34]
MYITQDNRQVFLRMELNIPEVHTGEFPDTLKLIKTYLPQALDCMCSNSQNLPFRQKVRDTAIGHLFEHLLLAYIYRDRSACPPVLPAVCGYTHWDWNRHPRGSFDITISLPRTHSSLLIPAVGRAVSLTDRILSSNMRKARAGRTAPHRYP